MIASKIWQKIIVLCWFLIICHTVNMISKNDMICILLKKTFEIYCWQIELKFYWERLLWIKCWERLLWINRWKRLFWVKLKKDFFNKILIEKKNMIKICEKIILKKYIDDENENLFEISNFSIEFVCRMRWCTWSLILLCCSMIWRTTKYRIICSQNWCRRLIFFDSWFENSNSFFSIS